MMKLATIFVAVAEISDSLSFEEPESELPLKYSIRIIEDTESMHFAPLEFAFVE